MLLELDSQARRLLRQVGNQSVAWRFGGARSKLFKLSHDRLVLVGQLCDFLRTLLPLDSTNDSRLLAIDRSGSIEAARKPQHLAVVECFAPIPLKAK